MLQFVVIECILDVESFSQRMVHLVYMLHENPSELSSVFVLNVDKGYIIMSLLPHPDYIDQSWSG